MLNLTQPSLVIIFTPIDGAVSKGVGNNIVILGGTELDIVATKTQFVPYTLQT